MDEDLDEIVPLTEELSEEIGSIGVGEKSASVEQEIEEDIYYENFDEFRFDVAMFVVEEDEEAIELEFEDAVSVMAGEKAFPCINCDKICKSKAGLTRHVNAKHGDKANTKGNEALSSSIALLTEEELASILVKIKAKITKDGFWDSEMTAKLVKLNSTKTLFNHILPIYERFCRKRNQDTFLMDFYELIPKSSVLLQCDDQQLCCLIMISIPDHLVSLFKQSQQQPAIEEKDASELSEIERGPLSYIAGYVLSQLRKKSSNDELQLLIQTMMCPSSENTYIKTRSRGGLVTPCNDLVKILEVAEIIFHQFTTKQSSVVKSIPSEKLCNDTLDSPLVKSLWDNILQGCGQEISKQTHKICLENIIILYLKVRSFSYAKDYINKFKVQQKSGKSKALRKELKRKSSDKE